VLLPNVQEWEIEATGDYLSAFELGSEFDYLVGLGPIRVGQNPTGFSIEILLRSHLGQV
jgi:hypothetical protein